MVGVLCLAFAFFSARVFAFVFEDEPDAKETQTVADFHSGVGSARVSFSTRSDDFLRRDAKGVQTRYPSVAKIVGRSITKEREDGTQMVPVYYGTGCYVAEYGAWGIVLTNWHVVSESDAAVDVVFPTSGLFPARVILRDEVWDVAALLIERPDDLLPIPISLEVPKLGEKFWVGGYGQKSGLDDFQLQAGYLQNYVSLVDPDDSSESESVPSGVDAILPSANVNQGVYLRPPPRMKKALYETLAIKRGVRRGDSGGPIFNRYGELAGILWGSDGKSTMGTVDLRLQEFLTQAIRRAARYCAEQSLDAEAMGAKFDERTPVDSPLSNVVDADGAELSMYDALLRDGIFSISSRSVYVSADVSVSAETLARVTKEEALKKVLVSSQKTSKLDSEGPPFPPIYSPTFVVQQRETKQISPEKINPEIAARLDAVVLAQVTKERASFQTRDESELEVSQTANKESQTRKTALGTNDSPRFADASETAQRAPSEFSEEDDSEKDLRVDVTEETISEFDKVDKETETSARGGVYLSTIQTYALFCVLFIFFYLAARGMNIESDVERKKRGKIRLHND